MKQLKNIIKAMSKREKYYFSKLHSNAREKIFFLLYSFLLQHPGADIKTIRQKFRNTGIEKNTHTEINYLYNHILRALHIYRMNAKGSENQIFQNLQYFQILIEKKEIKQARKLLAKAKKIAFYHQEYPLLVKIISIEEELNFSSLDTGLPQKLKALNDERADCINGIQDKIQLRLLKMEAIDLQYKVGLHIEDLSPFQHIFGHEIMNNFDRLKSIVAQDHWYFVKGIEYFLIGQYEHANSLVDKRIELHKKYNHIFEELELIKILNNALFTLVQTNLYQEFQEKLKALNSFRNSNKISPVFIDYFDFYLQMCMELRMNHWEKLTIISNKAKRFLNDQGIALNPIQANDLFFILSASYIRLRDFDSVMSLLPVWNKLELQPLQFILRKANRLISFYSLKHLILLSSELDTFKKAIKKFKIESRIFEALILFFKNLIKDTKKHDFLFCNLYSSLLAASNMASERKFNMEFDYIGWAKDLAANPLEIYK